MVRKDSRCIPHGYIGDYVDRPKDTDLYSSSLEIPIIDFSLQFNITFWGKKKKKTFLLLSGDKEEPEKLQQAWMKQLGYLLGVK